MRVVEEFLAVEQKLAAADAETTEREIDIPATTNRELSVEEDNERVTARRWSRLAADARANVEEACYVDGAKRCCTLADILRAPKEINRPLALGSLGTQRLAAPLRTGNNAAENVRRGGHRVLAKVGERD